eukprot:3739571-Pyramimonas_sp.AAC.1
MGRWTFAQVVSRCLKDPRLVLTLPCKIVPSRVPSEDEDRLRLRISADIELCNYIDPVFSPYVDGLRNQVGREFEAYLEERLRKAGIAFRGEEELRAEGQAKTPDIKLDIPIAVRGKIVNWIDSKASFCDQFTYKHKGLDQFQGYVCQHPASNAFLKNLMSKRLGPKSNPTPLAQTIPLFPAAIRIAQIPLC